jgi:ribonucleoside-diphosphate reductase alpha chain
MMDKYKEYSNLRTQLQESGEVPEWMATAGFQLIKGKQYIGENETVKQRFETISDTLVQHLPEQFRDHYRERFFELQWKGYLGPATPVYCNVGKPEKGLPISCSGTYCPDSVSGFYEVAHEIAMLSKHGFGTSVYLGDVRPRGSSITNGSIADGVVPVLDLIYNTANHISQGSTRRGSVACYLPVSHDDFEEVCHWLENNSDGSNFGWGFTDEDIQKLHDQDPDMIKRYQEVMYLRMLGIGYIFLVDNANRLSPEVYKKNDLSIKNTNLCTEIFLYNSEKYSFTCCLSSLNLAYWDDIEKDPTIISDSVIFLDCVNSEFIKQSEGIKGIEKARDFAAWSRPVGLGAMGLSTYMQTKSIIFDSFEGHLLNTNIFRTIKEYADKANEWMGKELGEPELMMGTGLRCSHTISVAPTLCVTADTKIILENDDIIDYYTLIKDGGLDFNGITDIKVELDDGSILNFKYNDLIKVSRNDKVIEIYVSDLHEDDDLII